MITRASARRAINNAPTPLPPTQRHPGLGDRQPPNSLDVSLAFARIEERKILTRIDPDSTEGATREFILFFESIWYQVGNCQLLNTFAGDNRCIVMPQQAIRRFVHDDERDIDVLKARTPDFCVARLKLRKARTSQSITIKSNRIILLLEMKRSARSYNQYRKLRSEAWEQALEQAQFLFAKDKTQNAVGVMISVGDKWGFKLINRSDVHALSDNVDTSFTSKDAAEVSMSSEDSDERGGLPRHASGLPDEPYPLYTFGTPASDAQQAEMYKIVSALGPE